MTQMQKTRQRAMWWAFINGRNALNKRFATWRDVQELLRDYRQPSLAEGREMLADVKRPKKISVNACISMLQVSDHMCRPIRSHERENRTRWIRWERTSGIYRTTRIN